MDKDLDRESQKKEKEIVDAAIESGQLMDLWMLSAEPRKQVLLSTQDQTNEGTWMKEPR